MTIKKLAELYDLGWTMEKLARHFGKSVSGIAHIMDKHGINRRSPHLRKKKNVDVDLIVALYDSGMSFEKIGRKLGHSTYLVWSRYVQTGKPSRGKRVKKKNYCRF